MSKYEPITRHLNAQPSHRVTMGFAEIERLIGFPLPQSARKYPAWWANNADAGRHAGAWLAASWKSEDVDLAAEKVSFSRSERNVAGRSEQAVTSAQTACTEPNTDNADDCDGFEMQLALKWRMIGTLVCDLSGSLLFPKIEPAPGLYRFRLSGNFGQRSYVGETVNLRRRFAHYRKPGPTQATNIRMNQVLREHLEAGGLINIDVVTDSVLLRIDGSALPVDLDSKSVRRLLENAALVHGVGLNIESLNQ
jgi:hypothetical protein